jgi:xanthine dehydrogenase YagR molybdenum-binding subunit
MPTSTKYKIAGARETPAIRTIFVEHEQGRTSTEVNGLGEPANIATAAPIANAVYTLAAAAASKKGGSAR